MLRVPVTQRDQNLFRGWVAVNMSPAMVFFFRYFVRSHAEYHTFTKEHSLKEEQSAFDRKIRLSRHWEGAA